jgi:shikimate dehydrogenase
MLLIDIVCNHLVTKLIKESKEVGVKTIKGVDKFINQGVEAFELWTDKKASIESMKKVVLKVWESD